jgi:enamine deaminase RidA (YjgF/YER057c/UK114 family)
MPDTSHDAKLTQHFAKKNNKASGRQPMVDIQYINPPELGESPGYSQIVDCCSTRTIYIAGQTALDENGELVGKDDFPSQADQVFKNLSIALGAAQCDVASLVKLTVYLRDMSNLSVYREARNRFFNQSTPRAAPAVTLVEVSRLYGPDFLIEIDAIAVR